MTPSLEMGNFFRIRRPRRVGVAPLTVYAELVGRENLHVWLRGAMNVTGWPGEFSMKS